MSAKKIFTNSVLILIGEVFERILRLVLVVFSARILGDADYGKFTFALSFTSLFLILADGGIHQLLVREIARNPEKSQEYVANAFGLKLILSAVTLGLIFSLIHLTGKPPDVLLAVYIMGAALIVGSFSEFFSSVFRAHQRMTYDVMATLIFGTSVTGIGIAILVLGFDYVTLAYVYLFAQFARFLYCLITLQTRFVKMRIAFDRGVVAFLIRQGLPFGILYFFALLYTYVDSTMLSIMVGDAAVGWYNAAYRLVFAMLFIPVACMKAIFPALSLYYQQSRASFQALFERSFKMMFLIGFTLASLIFVLADRIILLIFGQEYAPAAGALKILVWSTAIIFIGTVQTHTTRASNRQGFTAKVVASSAILNVILNVILIPKYSLYGAAFATLAAELFTFLFHSRYLARHLVAPPFLKLAPKIALICTVSALYVIVFYELGLAIIVPSSVVIVLGMLLITRYFSKEEIQFFKNLLKTPGKLPV